VSSNRAIFDAVQLRPFAEHSSEACEQRAAFGGWYRLPTGTTLRGKCVEKTSDLRVQSLVLTFQVDRVLMRESEAILKPHGLIVEILGQTSSVGE